MRDKNKVIVSIINKVKILILWENKKSNFFKKKFKSWWLTIEIFYSVFKYFDDKNAVQILNKVK